MDDPALLEALGISQRLGMLGDRRSIVEVVEHAGAFVTALAAVTGTVVDLGSGGGVPGLVIARARPDLEVVLVERRTARADHLRRLVGRLDLGDRVRVLACDAVQLPAVLPALVDAVVARGFAAPAETARRAAVLVRRGGLVVVSEPPHRATDRWPEAELAELGLESVPSRDARVVCFRRSGAIEVPRES